MNNSVTYVDTNITILFSNGKSLKLPFKNDNSQNTDLKNFGTSCNLKEKLYNPSSSNIIGDVCSNTLTLDITSYDGLLISSNEESEYFGYMDSSARISISVIGDDNIETNLGIYYVDAWENGASAGEYTNVTITASDIMQRVKNISLGKINLKEHLKFSEYIIGIVDSLNKLLPNDMNIQYTQSEIEKLDTIYGDDWQMWFNNIDRTDIETVFNTIAQNTLSYIWIDRNGYLKVDCLLDDKEEQAVCELSGSTNLLSYSVHNTDIYNYDGVKTKYISSISYSDEELLNMSDYELVSGSQTITAKLNSNKVKDIHHIEIVTDTGIAICKSFYYYRDYIEMNIDSSANTVADIIVFGKVIKESYDEKTVFKGSKQSTVLEIENYILRGASKISKYTNCFAELLQLKNAIIQVEGFINPQVKLDDMIKVIGKKLKISSNYKVIELDFTFGVNYDCKAKLIRTVNVSV